MPMIDPIIRHHHVIAAHKVGLLDARIRLRYFYKTKYSNRKRRVQS